MRARAHPVPSSFARLAPTGLGRLWTCLGNLCSRLLQAPPLDELSGSVRFPAGQNPRRQLAGASSRHRCSRRSADFERNLQTRSSDSLVTDSAAGATAFSCAQKSYNGAVAVEPEGRHRPLGTVMEAAKAEGYKTGLVVTRRVSMASSAAPRRERSGGHADPFFCPSFLAGSRITHATPACFYSHVVDRDMESEIAEFL